ncbi:hypothetical protein DYE50_06180 [Treponema ruminis]|uniref:Putative nucleotidyltransferase n=1 Tax=Treponema ruminis TaxID=744515 RepID=A0A7W8GA00_9SPIR|nr:hypothetical protein [Treponema ruminis]MBB5226614.1 putative nucleotidyltransferase [Treponema ruminis]QSI02157.1 hypothetical protein DYE50_06180 [Treponema ruminis]
MKNKNVIIAQQKDFISKMKAAAQNFIASTDKSEIETILLSGSVARGDYFPRQDEKGGYVGMIDLIVMKKKGSSATAEKIFGPNQEPAIPYHCIKSGDLWFAIWFTDFISADDFVHFEEARKFSILEAEILYDKTKMYEAELKKINQIKTEECEKKLSDNIGYIHYLLSDYKKDRWERRAALLQLNENLNTAIRIGVCALYYKNNSYAPAEDRQLYYSLTLENLPENYESVITELKNQNVTSLEDYKRREDLFRSTLLDFIMTAFHR